MKIRLICIGKTADKKIQSLMEDYLKRLKHYAKFSIEIIEYKKKKNDPNALRISEGEVILEKISSQTTLILLDELGDSFSSVKFSAFLQKRLNHSLHEIVFIIGGAYGFSEKVYERANYKIALSKMTFTHQMVRLIFIEQLYRAFTIIKGEKYHH